ncbi:endolysin [Mycobacterium phage Tonenili]|uniref:Lysin A n=1 Tax=Mycobacterium phage Tonenili TaxID=1891703 RepID=A0A1C9EHM2_9CAUD|nr:endolysin [Mycobacterium phage Tonenili]AON96990.1 lysin A [Mycobacterium phage Tonenili]
MPVYTKDNIAIGIIAEGRRARSGQGQLDHPVISEKGIVIALATGLVESNLTMYANRADPDSLKYPHDAVGSDANSVGVFQQRAPWWGTLADRMDVARSAAMFYGSLARQRIVDNAGTPNEKRFDYNTDRVSPGTWAQMVQKSAFPDRYDQRMAEARKIYDRLKGEQGPPVDTPTPTVPNPPQYSEFIAFGRGYSARTRPPTNFFIHTEEGNGTAKSLSDYCQGQNGVSYHYTLRDRIVYCPVDTDYASWSVLSANVFSINLCFAGSRAAMSRQEWLAREADIEIAAYLAVQDCRKYNFSTEVIPPPYAGSARPGISDHKYVTQKLGIGDHTDVGSNFPWDVFAKYVRKYADGVSVGDPILELLAMPTNQEKLDFIFAEESKKFASRSIYATPGEGLVDTRAGFVLNVDAMTHQDLVERLAIQYHDDDAIARIVRVASGQGANPNDTWAKEHALTVLQKIPEEVLKAWQEKNR